MTDQRILARSCYMDYAGIFADPLKFPKKYDIMESQ